MTFKLEKIYTNIKDNFDTMENYRQGRFDREKVRTLIDNIHKENHKL